MNYINGIFITICLFIIGVAYGCAGTENSPVGTVQQPVNATPMQEASNIAEVTKIYQSFSHTVYLLKFEGHEYVRWGGSSQVHSASCPHRSHPGLGEIY
jgi:hypothetical protein